MKRDHLLGFFQVNEFTAKTWAEKHRDKIAIQNARRGKISLNPKTAKKIDKLETAKLEAPTAKVNHGEKADPAETSDGWNKGAPNMSGKFKARSAASRGRVYELVFYRGFWYGETESVKGLDNPKIRAEYIGARCAQNWEWQTIPEEHYILIEKGPGNA